MRRIWVDPWRTNNRMREFSQWTDSQIRYAVDFSSAATQRGTTVSSVTWTSEGTLQLSASNESLTSGVAQADVSGGDSFHGFGLMKVTATYADGTTENAYFKVRVEDPELV